MGYKDSAEYAFSKLEKIANQLKEIPGVSDVYGPENDGTMITVGFTIPFNEEFEEADAYIEEAVLEALGESFDEFNGDIDWTGVGSLTYELDDSEIVDSKIKDSDLSVGDIYNDGTYSGKVTDIASDHIVIESQNEDGDVVNIEVPIEDALNTDIEEYTDDDEQDTVRLAIDAVDDDVDDILYADGVVEFPIPEGVNPEEFAKEVFFQVELLWNAVPEDHNPPLAYAVDDASVYVYIEESITE